MSITAAGKLIAANKIEQKTENTLPGGEGSGTAYASEYSRLPSFPGSTSSALCPRMKPFARGIARATLTTARHRIRNGSVFFQPEKGAERRITPRLQAPSPGHTRARQHLSAVDSATIDCTLTTTSTSVSCAEDMLRPLASLVGCQHPTTDGPSIEVLVNTVLSHDHLVLATPFV